MKKAERGDVVKVRYTGRLEDGKVFDSSADRPSLEFKLGEGRLIKGFEEALKGMRKNERKTVKIAVDKAYGPRHQELIFEIARSSLPSGLNPEVGQQLSGKQRNGRTAEFAIVELSDTAVKVDANHPLAGKDLVFDIELIEIFEAV